MCRAVAIAAAIVAFASAPAASAADVSCSRVAAPYGFDSAAGTVTSPFRSVQRLASSLSAGQTGCLRAGTYTGDVKVARGGTSSARLTLRNYPGEKAIVRGRLWIARGADYVTVENLYLNGVNASNLPSPTVNAVSTVFRRNDVTNDHTAICFNLGHSTYGQAVGTLIENNRIHDCGRLPATNHDHGVYVARAGFTTIRDNWIYENADRGIQLYPNAQFTWITGNVIDGNGQGIAFGGRGSDSSDDTQVEGNVISNSRLRYNVESHYDAGVPPGRGNVVRRNCISGGTRDDGDGGIDPTPEGFSASSNTTASGALAFVDRPARDFRPVAGSICASVAPNTAIVPGPQ